MNRSHLGSVFLEHSQHLALLGSHITSSALVEEELQLHMQKRYVSVIKFYNFIRSNRSAPLKVKLKVLESCVMHSILHNCETFGDYLPKDLESTYMKLLKSCLNVRTSTPNLLVLIESGFLPIKAVIYCRQLKFYKRFSDSIQPDSRRNHVFRFLLQHQTRFLKHYETLSSKYSSTEEIISEYRNEVKAKVYKFADDSKYKFGIYAKMNPDLRRSPFLDVYHPVANDIVKFRLGSHYLPIETGRWRGIARTERLCTACGVLGDERHALYSCSLILRDDVVLDEYLHHIWYQPEVFKLFKRLKEAKYL